MSFTLRRQRSSDSSRSARPSVWRFGRALRLAPGRTGSVGGIFLLAGLALGGGAALVLPAGLALGAGAQQIPGASTDSMAALTRGEWPTYAGSYASAKYSPLDQINAANVASLKVAWRWMSPDHAVRAANAGIDPSVTHQGTPIMVNGVLYTSTSLSQVAAIDAATGQTKWVFDPGSHKLGMPTNNGWL